jgi:hypothetical protein
LTARSNGSQSDSNHLFDRWSVLSFWLKLILKKHKTCKCFLQESIEITIKWLISLLKECWSRAPFPDHTDDNFQNECLHSHNVFRAEHHAPPLKIDNSVSPYYLLLISYRSKYCICIAFEFCSNNFLKYDWVKNKLFKVIFFYFFFINCKPNSDFV